MRTVFNNRELCHVWAHKSQKHGRGSNLFFEGDSIYSYGHHFEVARHVEHNGGSAVLFNIETYSPSTSKHQCYVSRAINHLCTFHVPLATSRYGGNATDPQFFFASYQHRFNDSLDKASRARSNKEWHIQTARNMAVEGNELAKFFGLENRIELPENFDELLEVARAASAKRSREQAEKTRKENEERRIKAADSLGRWRKGELGYVTWLNYLDGDCLRLSADGQTVETTRGATVPADHARRAYRIMSRLHEQHQTYQRNGHTHHVGHYAIDRMDATGLVNIGCHKIKWEEIERLATLANWSSDDENQHHAGCEENNSGTNEVHGTNAIGTGRTSEGSDSADGRS